MSHVVSVSINGTSYEVVFEEIAYSTEQVSVPAEDGTSTSTTYLNAHCQSRVKDSPIIMITTTRLQEIVKVEIDETGSKTSISVTPLKFNSIEDVIKSTVEDVKKNLLSSQIDSLEESTIKEVTGKMSLLVV